MDVDGTFTDGKIYMSDSGELFKAFDIKDGCGIKDILSILGVEPIITARNSKILENRCKELAITRLYQCVRNKKQKLDEIIEEFNEQNATCLNYSNIAYIGDDILDLQCVTPIKKSGGVIGCPSDAVDSVKEIADFISKKNGGNGAVRELIEYLSR